MRLLILLIILALVTVYCVPTQPSKLKLLANLIDQQLNLLERAVLTAQRLTEKASSLKDSSYSEKRSLLLQKCCDMFGTRMHYFMNKSNNIKRKVINMLLIPIKTAEADMKVMVEKETSALSQELKQFFVHDIQDYYYETGRGMNLTETELDKNFVALGEVFSRGMEGGMPF